MLGGVSGTHASSGHAPARIGIAEGRLQAPLTHTRPPPPRRATRSTRTITWNLSQRSYSTVATGEGTTKNHPDFWVACLAHCSRGAC